MTGTTRSSGGLASEGLDLRRRKLLFRSWHRGLRELDLILGAFADASVGDLTETEIEQYEHLLDIPDTELLAWLTGEQLLPAERRSALFDRIVASRRATPF